MIYVTRKEKKIYMYWNSWRKWLAKQETLTHSGRLISPLVLERNQRSLNVHHSSLLLHHDVDALVFYVIHPYFFTYFRESLSSEYSFANWRYVWHVTIIWPFRSVTLQNRYILHSHWNWFYESSVLCSAHLTYVFKLSFCELTRWAIFFVYELFLTAAHFVMKFHRERTDCSSRLPLDLRFFVFSVQPLIMILNYFIWKGIGVTILLYLLVIQMPFCVRSCISITCYVTLFNDYSSKFHSYSFWLCAISWLVHTFNVQSSMLLTDICFILPLSSLKFNSIVT